MMNLSHQYHNSKVTFNVHNEAKQIHPMQPSIYSFVLSFHWVNSDLNLEYQPEESCSDRKDLNTSDLISLSR